MIQNSGGNPVYIQEGVPYGTTGFIILFVWGDMMDTVEEHNLHCFTQVSLENYFGKKLTASKMSVATVHKSYLNKDQDTKKIVNPKPCCLELLNIELDVFLGRTNKQWNKRLNFPPGAKIVTWHHCSSIMRADKSSCVFYYVISFEDKMLTLPIEVVSSFLKDVINMCRTDTFKEKFLFLENVDYVYNSKNKRTAIERH